MPDRLRLVRRAQRHNREARVELGREREEVVLVGADAVEEDEERRGGRGRARRKMDVAEGHGPVL